MVDSDSDYETTVTAVISGPYQDDQVLLYDVELPPDLMFPGKEGLGFLDHGTDVYNLVAEACAKQRSEDLDDEVDVDDITVHLAFRGNPQVIFDWRN